MATTASKMNQQPSVLRTGELEIRPIEGLVIAGGQALRLSVREFDPQDA
ncbi:unannotated protein [freshwater metagenome]|uniref:Unannotated protein n=1 Tax=freshwater metagenome TaxID=449393 RepID=A0A6J7CY11_9ZZZZ|nr:hypothetical protein [Actinomycetota bacterium]